MKKSIIKTFGVFLMSAALLMAVSGCGEKETTDNKSDEGKVVEESVVAPENTVEEQPEQETPAEVESEAAKEQQSEETEKIINPLTGEVCSEQVAQTRPVAIMLNNLKEALPQMGISRAAVLYEILAEGGITRFVGVFNEFSDIEEIGSIRSSRDYYIDIADAHDAVYVHAGQSEVARKTLVSRGTNNINGDLMYRSEERLKTKAYEHTLMITGEALTKAIKAKGYRDTTDKPQPFVFYETETVPEGEDVSYMEIPFIMGKNSHPYAVAFFNFDKETGIYKKGQFGADHIDGIDGSVLTFKNVIILECAHGMLDNEGRITVGFTGTGKGKVYTMGKCSEIVWKKQSRTSSYSLYESDGETPFKLNPGKSYVGIVPTGTTVITK